MDRRPTMIVIGYPSRLVADHAALLESAGAAGFDAELVSPGRLALAVDDTGTHVLVDGVPARPDVVLPRGVNRPWPFVKQVLEVWQHDGVHVVPAITACDVCNDKLATTRALAAAGVPVLPTIGVAPDDGVRLTPLAKDAPLVAKPARASKGLGVERFAEADDAEAALGAMRPLVAGMVDHHVVQPLATDWGVDFRVVVARIDRATRVVALTERRAAPGSLVTNGDGSTVVDLAADTHPDVVAVALAAGDALGLAFAGVDVIRHRGEATVLEVNAWPGLAAEVRGRQIADTLLAAASVGVGPGVAAPRPDR